MTYETLPHETLTDAELRDLRALAGTAEVAQRMGRLALGANTENVGHAGIAGHPIEVTSIPVEVYLEARAKVVDAY